MSTVTIISHSPSDTLDRSRFAELYTEAYPRLFLVGYGMLGDRGLAEDTVQDAVALALGKLETFTPGTYFTAWLSQFIRHVALNQRRRRRRRFTLSLDHEEASPPATSAAPVSTGRLLEDDCGHFDDRVSAALLTLKPVARACLLLRTVAEMDYVEIAQTLDLPQGTAMSHVYRARKALRKQLASASNPGDSR